MSYIFQMSHLMKMGRITSFVIVIVVIYLEGNIPINTLMKTVNMDQGRVGTFAKSVAMNVVLPLVRIILPKGS